MIHKPVPAAENQFLLLHAENAEGNLDIADIDPAPQISDQISYKFYQPLKSGHTCTKGLLRRALPAKRNHHEESRRVRGQNLALKCSEKVI